ncbi:MAG: phenylacetate-CoA oxygenase subunit PaaC [Burkholderiaceae bacterium]|jgi:ring-1,2-phenylacetyl-CoA epoxidase subunit PaaC|nr:phenylacetate-CoA oxygenase subunit PaaC [Burkholderiaceae bacterium]
MSNASIQLELTPAVQYLLRIGDSALILAQRLGEWTGRAPILEEDIAMANIALDLIGQSRALLTLAGGLQSPALDEDQLAFLRVERDYFNVTMAELPRGDFAFSVLRNAMLSTWFKLLWARLAEESVNDELRAIAAKALKEARYHQQHSADWVVRLGDGSEESHRRMQVALDALWRYASELFDTDAADVAAAEAGWGPRWSELREAWMLEMSAMLQEATLPVPADSKFQSDGKRGRHSEHMGFMLADLQYLQRAFPGGAW